jgi:hypothetical protein
MMNTFAMPLEIVDCTETSVFSTATRLNALKWFFVPRNVFPTDSK